MNKTIVKSAERVHGSYEWAHSNVKNWSFVNFMKKFRCERNQQPSSKPKILFGQVFYIKMNLHCWMSFVRRSSCVKCLQPFHHLRNAWKYVAKANSAGVELIFCIDFFSTLSHTFVVLFRGFPTTYFECNVKVEWNRVLHRNANISMFDVYSMIVYRIFHEGFL